MKWKKLGLVYCPDGSMPWALHSALTPTPTIRKNGLIRVFAGFRDERGVSRIGAVDLDPENPTRVLHVSRTPVLDIGQAGAFDDNGVIMGDVIEDGEGLLMFFIGFQLVANVKFLAFTGAARSVDGGDTFHRVSNAPVLDRCDRGLYFHAIHSVMRDGDQLRAWCGTGNAWQDIGGKPFPAYGVSEVHGGVDGFSRTPRVCIEPVGNEYRIGRPRVYRTEGLWRMFYTVGTRQGSYLPGYAESRDGVTWARRDEEVGLSLSPSGWDSTALSYPALLTVGRKTWVFYNGNEMGKTGFGVAELEQW